MADVNSLAQLNALTPEQANDWFMQTCTATKWCQLMSSSRPFHSIADIEQTAGKHWQTMQQSDFFEAFDGHPMIGDLSTLRAKYAGTKGLASNEQSGAAAADEGTLIALQQGNQDYLDKHGFIFIICATGLSAATMLNELLKRLHNPTAVEIIIAAQEQMKITLLRIYKTLIHKDTRHE